MALPPGKLAVGAESAEMGREDDSMNHPNFSEMTDEELRAYVLTYRQDQTAFHAYVDRMQQRPPIAIIEPEEWSEERMLQVFGEIEQHKQK